MTVVAAPPGAGKTTAGAAWIAGQAPALWLTDRHEDVAAATAAIEAAGGIVGRPIPVTGKTNGVPNCLHPDTIKAWQHKGYSYVPGFCHHHTKDGKPLCIREGDTDRCPYLKALDDLAKAPIVVTTKAYATRPTFFTKKPHDKRKTIVLDEDPIDLLRPPVEFTRDDLEKYLVTCKDLERIFLKKADGDGFREIGRTRAVAQWCLVQIGRQQPDPEAQPEPVDVPDGLGTIVAREDDDPKGGRRSAERLFLWLMRRDPEGTVRNVHRDLDYMVEHAAARTVYATSKCLTFHLEIRIPLGRTVVVLDATANLELLRPIFAPMPVRVTCDHPVKPAGRIIQFMDFNGPRSYLNKLPSKVVRIIDAIGRRHQSGKIVLISHLSCVKQLAEKSNHKDRIVTAHFGAVRGRNDLEAAPGRPIACHVVIGSPKTTEEDRRRLALAVYGRAILPFGDLIDVRRSACGKPPQELADGDEFVIWEAKIKGYADPRMQHVYEHTVTAELTHAADRARVLIHPDAVVYLVTNEPCPRLPFVERCYAGDYLEITKMKRSDFRQNYDLYKMKAVEMLNAGKTIGNADVCRALEKTNSWGWRYWNRFIEEFSDSLEHGRKVRWREG